MVSAFMTELESSRKRRAFFCSFNSLVDVREVFSWTIYWKEVIIVHKWSLVCRNDQKSIEAFYWFPGLRNIFVPQALEVCASETCNWLVILVSDTVSCL